MYSDSTISLASGQAYFDNWRNLTPADNAVLNAIRELGEPILQEIGQLCDMCRKQVQRSVDKLEELEIIQTWRQGRARACRIFLSPNSDQYGTHAVPYSDSILNTNTDINKSDDQMVLIENNHNQNLRSLDIDPQQLPQPIQENLAEFEINADVKQCFDTAPDLCKKYKPAQILMFFDDDNRIANNLALWRKKWDAGETDLTGLSSALIWVKIVELQEPPEKEPLPKIFNRKPAPVELTGECETQDCTEPVTELLDDCQDDDFAALVGTLGYSKHDSHLIGSKIISQDAGIITVAVKTEANRLWLSNHLKSAIMRKIGHLYDDVRFEI